MASNNPIEDMIPDVLAAQAQAAAEIREEVQRLIGVPVEYVGGRIIRSKPGEPPRRETGRLQTSIATETTLDGMTVTSRVFTDVYYAATLQDLMSRPILEGILDRFEDRILELLVDAIEGNVASRVGAVLEPV